MIRESFNLSINVINVDFEVFNAWKNFLNRSRSFDHYFVYCENIINIGFKKNIGFKNNWLKRMYNQF